MSKRIRINYVINRKVGRKITHTSGRMFIVGRNDDATHDKIRRIIRRRHPKWNITGWAMPLMRRYR